MIPNSFYKANITLIPKSEKDNTTQRPISLKNIYAKMFNNIFTNCIQFSSVAQPCPTLCDPMNHSTSGLPIHHQLLEFTQTHVHRVNGAIQPSHLLLSPPPPALNPSQHHSLFQ